MPVNKLILGDNLETLEAKQFDCIELKQAIQSQIMIETTGMSAGELLAYFNNPAGAGASMLFNAPQPHGMSISPDSKNNGFNDKNDW
jgi:hypothetical protein